MNFNIKKTRIAIFLIISILLHLLASIYYFNEKEKFSLPAEWTLNFTILLLLSFIGMLLMYSLKFKQLRLFLGALRGIAFLIIGIPFGDSLEIEYILLFSLIMDYTLLFVSPFGTIFSLLILALSAVFQFPMKIYGIPRAGVGLTKLLVYIFINIALTTICTLLKSSWEHIDNSEKQIINLNEVISRLIKTNKGYLEYATKIEKETTEKERKRIIQDLHDIVGKAFTNIHAMMDASLKHPPEDVEEYTMIHSWVKEQAQIGLTETRSALYKLREIREPELQGINALQHIINTFTKATQTIVKVSWGNFPWTILPEADTVVQQVIQESLVNAFRHGKATNIDIQFWIDEKNLILNIQDNGRGGETGKKGIGQSSMEEHVKKLGGKINFFSNSEGYRVCLTIPRERVTTNDNNGTEG